MASKTASKRTANDTPARVELDAVSTFDATVVETFISTAEGRRTGFHAEARDYVAAVDARNGKRGADAAVQRIIATALVAAGFTPYSHARYSKLSAAFRALASLGRAGIDASHVVAFDALYALWNVPSSKLSATDRDAVVEAAGRKRSPEAAIATIQAAIVQATAKSPEPKGTDADTDTDADAEEIGTAPADTASGVTLHSAADMVRMIEAFTGMLDALSDAERVALADAAQDLADAAHALIIPADASTLTDAAA